MYKVNVMENLIYDEQIGEAGLLDLYLPEVPEGTEIPLLIYFHGGGLEIGTKSDGNGMYLELASNGLAIMTANYRMYPDVGFPVFIEDAAKAVSYSIQHINEYANCSSIWVGGISAGGYLSMMLHFNTSFLSACGVDESIIAGYIFDAGQPTVHFNVLRERGIDTGAVRVDEAAPIYYLTDPYVANLQQRFLVISAENDIPGRQQQNELLIRTMETHGYDSEQLEYKVMPGFTHAGYVEAQDSDGHYPYSDMIWEFINSRK